MIGDAKEEKTCRTPRERGRCKGQAAGQGWMPGCDVDVGTASAKSLQVVSGATQVSGLRGTLLSGSGTEDYLTGPVDGV